MLYDIGFPSFNMLLNNPQFFFTCKCFSCSNVLVRELRKLQMPYYYFYSVFLCSALCLCAISYGPLLPELNGFDYLIYAVCLTVQCFLCCFSSSCFNCYSWSVCVNCLVLFSSVLHSFSFFMVILLLFLILVFTFRLCVPYDVVNK